MFFLFLLIFVLLNFEALTQDKILNCFEINDSEYSFFSSEFSKSINFKNKTLSNVSGGNNYFDKIVLFGRNEIILQNRIFDTFSTYNINKKIWTIYGNEQVKRYNCNEGNYRAPLW
tara:strand:- start:329 stop:676 length:348 start_codon:yes stop_codon:yes gene_type:complete